jgi:hypothetical protein
MIVYFVTRPPTALDESVPTAPQVDTPAVTVTPSTTDQLAQLSDLHDSGKLTDEEFTASKAELRGGQDDG